MPAKSDALRQAKAAKADEFYTSLEDIEKEMRYYRPFFAGKVVYCNCDDPYESNFFKYFALNFNHLKLKKLISVSYAGSPVAGREFTLFEDEEKQQKITGKKAYKVVMTELKDVTSDGREDMADVRELIKHRIRYMKGNGEYVAGDFRSDESIELLKEADIVVTNPPFSLFREYVAQLVKYQKNFVILGNQNNVSYKEIFPLIQNNQLWLGHKSGDMAFRVPAYYEPRETRFWIDKTGQKWRSFGTICWFTNLDYRERHEPLDLYKEYSPEDYPKYDNYDAIEVGKTADIPIDYNGIMGVPLTFLDKYCPDQFEIIGLDRYTVPKEFLVGGRLAINGQTKYARILIRRKKDK